MGDSASFDIDRATGQIMVGRRDRWTSTLDFEAEGEAVLHRHGHGHGPGARRIVGAEDSDEITVTINVTNVDEDPELTGMDSLRPMENTGIDTGTDTGTGTYMARTMRTEREIRRSSPDAVGADAGKFTLFDEADNGNGNGTYDRSRSCPTSRPRRTRAGTTSTR